MNNTEQILRKAIEVFEKEDMDILERYESDEVYEDDEWEKLIDYKNNKAELKGIQSERKRVCEILKEMEWTDEFNDFYKDTMGGEDVGYELMRFVLDKLIAKIN